MSYLKVHIREEGKDDGKTVRIPRKAAEGYIRMTARGLGQDPSNFGFSINTDGNGINMFVSALVQLSERNVRLYAKEIYKDFNIDSDNKYLLELSLEKNS